MTICASIPYPELPLALLWVHTLHPKFYSSTCLCVLPSLGSRVSPLNFEILGLIITFYSLSYLSSNIFLVSFHSSEYSKMWL